MLRVIAYIDGFNLYHSLKPNQKWLDLTKLVDHYLRASNTLSKIKYFTAICPWDAQKAQRHNTLIDIYKSQGIDVILGKFKKLTRRCTNRSAQCIGNHIFETYEEKQTDVNIAIHLINDAWEESFDKAIIISGDTDLLPAFDLLRKTFKDKKIEILFPPNRRADVIKNSYETIKISNKDLDKSLLDNPYILNNKEVFAPDSWMQKNRNYNKKENK